MESFATQRISFASLLLIAVISLILLLSSEKKGAVSSDGRGYYAYLPSLFFDHDLSFSSAIEAEKKIYQAPGYAGNYLNVVDGKHVNKYFIGEAVLLAPFFLLACLLSSLTGHPVDGYSYWFQFAVSFAAVCYLLLALNFIRKWLKMQGVSDKITAFCLLLIFFATNLFEYTMAYPSMSHIYSFFAISWFIYAAGKYIHTAERAALISAAIALAIVVLIRPVNGIIILALPFLAGDMETVRSVAGKISSHAGLLLYTLFLFSVIAFLQPLAWYVQTGHFILWSYTGEGFNFLKPEIFNLLFSYRKGWFVYTPVAFIACLGLIPLFIENKFRFFTLIVILLLIIYMLSSWWNWYYGDSFGMRAMIDFYALPAFLLARLLSSLQKGSLKIAVACILLFTVYLNQVQTYQYNHMILHFDEMTKAKYWGVFLKTGSQYEKAFYKAGQQAPPDIQQGRIIDTYKNDLEGMQDDWIHGVRAEEANAYSGKFVSALDSAAAYSVTLQPKDLAAIAGKAPLIIKATCYVYPFNIDTTSNVQLIVSIDSANGSNYLYTAIDISKNISTNNSWQKITEAIYLPEIKNNNDVLKFYIWNPNKKRLWLDDFEVIISQL